MALDSNIIANRARAEKAAKDAVKGEGINPAYVSNVVDTDPIDYVEGTGVPYGQKTTSDDLIQRLVWNDETEVWDNLGDPFPNKTYVDDEVLIEKNRAIAKEDELEASIAAASLGIKPFQTKALMDAFTPGDGGDNRELARVDNDSTASNNGDYAWNGSSWIKKADAVDLQDNVKLWAKTEGYFITDNLVKDQYGNVTSADIEWPNGVTGVISNVTAGFYGWTSARITYTNSSKYATVTITRDAFGDVEAINVTLTGF
jgi:hypothetical protein